MDIREKEAKRAKIAKGEIKTVPPSATRSKNFRKRYQTRAKK